MNKELLKIKVKFFFNALWSSGILTVGVLFVLAYFIKDAKLHCVYMGGCMMVAGLTGLAWSIKFNS